MVTVDHDHAVHSEDCRICRMGADLNRIRAIGQPENEPDRRPLQPLAVNLAHAFVGRFIWTEGQVRAIRRAADARVSLREFLSWVDGSRREVGGPGRK